MSQGVTQKQKIGLIAASVLVVIIFIEVALRTGGFFILRLQDYKNRAIHRHRDSYRIVCIGESMTALGGAPQGVDGTGSYPIQLEKILNNASAKGFRVINKGVPGWG